MLETSASSGNLFLEKKELAERVGSSARPINTGQFAAAKSLAIPFSPSWFWRTFSLASRRAEAQFLVNCYMLRFVALNEILGCFS